MAVVLGETTTEEEISEAPGLQRCWAGRDGLVFLIGSNLIRFSELRNKQGTCRYLGVYIAASRLLFLTLRCSHYYYYSRATLLNNQTGDDVNQNWPISETKRQSDGHEEWPIKSVETHFISGQREFLSGR
jgi:hypothetical protein